MARRIQSNAHRFAESELVLATSFESGYLRATASGKFSLERAKRHFLALLDVVARERVERVLVDGRGVTGRPRMLERFLYGEFAAAGAARLAKRQSSGAPKFAYVLLDPVLDPGRLGEVTARKRGMNVRAFDNLEDALQWLLQPDRQRPAPG
jgi:hypothetical protein